MARCRALETRTVISSEVDGVLDTVASIHSKLTGENGDEDVLESLRQLQALPMTFRVLEATKIGWVVNALRKSAWSEPARELASTLYRSWKNLADEHFRNSRRSQLPASKPRGISEQKLEATASPPEAPPKAAATKSVRASLPTKAKPPSGPSPSASRRKERSPTSSKDTATVKKKRSTQPSAATRMKTEQHDDASIRQRAAAVPKPAPASSSKPSGSDKEASRPAAPKTIKIVIKRPAPKAQLLPAADAPPPEPNRSKRKEAPTAASTDEARLAAAKRRLKEGYKEAADAKEKRRIQVIGVPGKATKRSAPGAMK
jgi:hypothetical protein